MPRSADRSVAALVLEVLPAGADPRRVETLLTRFTGLYRIGWEEAAVMAARALGGDEAVARLLPRLPQARPRQQTLLSFASPIPYK